MLFNLKPAPTRIVGSRAKQAMLKMQVKEVIPNMFINIVFDIYCVSYGCLLCL